MKASLFNIQFHYLDQSFHKIGNAYINSMVNAMVYLTTISIVLISEKNGH